MINESVEISKMLQNILIFIFIFGVGVIDLVRSISARNKNFTVFPEAKKKSGIVIISRIDAAELPNFKDLLEKVINIFEVFSKSLFTSKAGRHGITVNVATKASREIFQETETETETVGAVHVISDLRKLCESVAEVHCHKAINKGLVLSVKYDENLPTALDVDQNKLIFILNILLQNAVGLTAQGGVFFHISQKKCHWIFRILDSGVGMNPSDMDALFDRFNCSEINKSQVIRGRENRSSAALRKELTELVGGYLNIFSELNVGTTAEVSIPISNKEFGPVLLKNR